MSIPPSNPAGFSDVIPYRCVTKCHGLSRNVGSVICFDKHDTEKAPVQPFR